MTTWRIPAVHPPEPGHALRVVVDGKPVAVFATGDRLLAVDALCTHVGGPLDRGQVHEGVVTCPLHGSQFSLTDGKVLRGPATKPVRAYRARFETDALVLEAD
jgi:nitrite reductase/ring-hydroxylating ferredoxin subunit